MPQPLKRSSDSRKSLRVTAAKDGKKLYDVMLDDYEKGFSMENLDRFFSVLKKELVPFLKKVMEEGKTD